MSKQSPRYVKEPKPTPPKEDVESKSSSQSSDDEPETNIRQHKTFRDNANENEVETITIYCRTRKTVKKTAGGTTTMLATGGTLALCCGTTIITGGLATIPLAMGTIGVASTSYVAGGLVTGLLVNPRVMRFDFDNYDEANDAFRQMTTYKIMIRNGEVVQSHGKMRWIAELIGAAVTDASERGPGFMLDALPEPERRFNILRSPMTCGGSKMRVKMWKKFNIKMYTSDYQDTIEKKWKKISSMNSAILVLDGRVEKVYGKKAYVNELIGWYALSHSLPVESTNCLKLEDLDDI